MMEIFGLSYIPVIAEGRPVGTITTEDLVSRVVAHGLDPTKTRAADVMDTNVVTVSEDAEVEEAVQTMRSYQARRLLVLGYDGALSGVFTLTDLAMLWDTEDSGEVLRRIAQARTENKLKRAQGVAFAS